jgi:hypothetical protein
VNRVSACSFIVETDDLWQRRIERAYFDEAPRVERVGGEGRLVCPGDPRVRLSLSSVPWAVDPACSGDPFVRVPQLEREGISAEILFPTLSWALLSLSEPLRSACLIAYNSWVWNITTTSPRRFYAAALLPQGADGLAELQRVAAIGMKAAILPVETLGADLDGLWGLAASLGIPLILARVGGATPFEDFSTFSKESGELTRHAARAAAAVKFLVLGEAEEDAPDNVSFVVSDAGAASGRLFWGRFGAPPDSAVTDEGSAARYFNLPA